jgi:hypothetical protein
MELKPTKLELADINGGEEYQNGDGVQASTLNAVVKGVAYAQEIAESTLGFTPESAWDLIITSEMLQGTNLNTVLASASGRVFVKAVGEFQGTTINVRSAIKLIEFAPSVSFGGGEPTVVTISGTGNEDDCQIIKGACAYDTDGEYAPCVIQGFKGGVEHCHGEGWKFINCNNIEHCSFIAIDSCKNISHCNIGKPTRSQLLTISISNSTDIEDLYAPDTTMGGWEFTNCMFIRDIRATYSIKFILCKYISNIANVGFYSSVASYSDCKYVDPYTCVDFLTDEDVGKVQALTNDGSFATVSSAVGVSF